MSSMTPARARRAARTLVNRALRDVRRPVAVLAYHRVATLRDDPFGLAVSPERFDEQLAFLKAHYDVVRFEGDWSGVLRPAVAITFDDGYADNALTALPLLERHRMPATFFVTSGMVGRDREFWWDELERFALGGTATAARRARFRELHRLCRRDGPETVLAGLRGIAPPARPTHRALSNAELRRLAASPLATIGAHTRTHPSLATLSTRAQCAEILGSKADLEALLGAPVEVFSYPFGERADINPQTVRICATAFHKAALCHGGYIFPWTSPHLIPRMVVYDWDATTLSRRLGELGVA